MRITALIILLLASSAFARLHVYTAELMSTRLSVYVYYEGSKDPKESYQSALAQAQELAAAATDYDSGSELRRLEHAPIGEPQQLSDTLAQLLIEAFDYQDLTASTFDPTIGLRTRAWRESLRSGKLLSVPPAGGAEMRDGKFIRTGEPIGLDLGGIAKGFAVDLIFEELGKLENCSICIVLGGDVRVGSPPPGKVGWPVTLRLSKDREWEVTLANCAVSTSGDLYQSVEIDGATYSHIIDPQTGRGRTEPIAAAVISPTSTLCDVMATVACIDPEAFAKNARRLGVTSAYIIGENQERKIGNFPEALLP